MRFPSFMRHGGIKLLDERGRLSTSGFRGRVGRPFFAGNGAMAASPPFCCAKSGIFAPRRLPLGTRLVRENARIRPRGAWGFCPRTGVEVFAVKPVSSMSPRW